MNRIGNTLTSHPKKILFLIFVITSFLFHYAFISENKLIIDFSLEQMFPENDPEKLIYDNFRDKFPREDLSAMMIYTPPSHPLEINDLKVVDEVVENMKNISNLSNCINLSCFPCEDISYENMYTKNRPWNDNTNIAYFYDRKKTEYTDTLFFRVINDVSHSSYHKFEFSNLNGDKDLNSYDKNVIQDFKDQNFTDYKLDISDYEEDFLCFDAAYEISNSGKTTNLKVSSTPYYMIKGCPGDFSEQSISSLTHIKQANLSGERLFNFKISKGVSNKNIYFSDCGYDGMCPDHPSYPGEDEGEFDNIFNCEPFDCGEDGVCHPEKFYSFFDIKPPKNYNYPGEDEGEGDFSRLEYDYIYEEWRNIFSDEEYSCNQNNVCSFSNFDFVNNYNTEFEEFDCEPFNYSRINGELSIINDPIYGNTLLSETGQVGGIIYTLDGRVKNMSERTIFYNELDNIIRKQKNDYNWEWHDGGIPVLRTRYIELVNKERSTFIPLAFLVVTLILFFVFRDFRSIVLPIFTITLTLVWVSALMAYLNISINIISYLTYNLLMIIGCSNAIHIQMKYNEGLYSKKNNVNALRNVISSMGGALFLTSFTTSIGFFSLCMTNIKLTKEFGMILGIGVFIMFVMMITVLPLLLLLTKLPNRKNTIRLVKGGSFKFVTWVYELVTKQTKLIAFSSIIIFIIVAVGVFRIDYNVSVIDDLKPSNQIYQDIEAIEGNMGGVFPIEILLEFNNPITIRKNEDDFTKTKETFDTQGLNDEEILLRVDNSLDRDNLVLINSINEFKKEIMKIDKISSIISFTDLLPRLLSSNPFGKYADFNLSTNLEFNKNHSTDYLYEFNQIMNSSSASMLIESTRTFITNDFKTVRFSGRMLNIKAQEAKNIKNKINLLARKYFGNNASVSTTGSTFLALKTADHLVYNLTNSFGLAFLIIFLSMVVLFKSLRLSLIAVLPNVIPLMLAAAVMGYQDIKLRPTTAMTFAIALGIAVDDTIHFLARFRQEYFKNNNLKLSIKNTLFTTGKAIISTTMVLSLGFAVLYFSELMPNHEFGILATIILIVALIGSIVLLPALLILFEPKIKLPETK